jgi:murein L,D-transpeptidase YcbB/YkuD
MNFREMPKFSAWKYYPLSKLGAGGPRVLWLARCLSVIRDPQTKRPYVMRKVTTYDRGLRNSVVQFQKDHKLVPDGIVGILTANMIGGMYERELANRRKK